jgi:hypothetical protein
MPRQNSTEYMRRVRLLCVYQQGKTPFIWPFIWWCMLMGYAFKFMDILILGIYTLNSNARLEAFVIQWNKTKLSARENHFPSRVLHGISKCEILLFCMPQACVPVNKCLVADKELKKYWPSTWLSTSSAWLSTLKKHSPKHKDLKTWNDTHCIHRTMSHFRAHAFLIPSRQLTPCLHKVHQTIFMLILLAWTNGIDLQTCWSDQPSPRGVCQQKNQGIPFLVGNLTVMFNILNVHPVFWYCCCC